jgi:hypothetical protein
LALQISGWAPVQRSSPTPHAGGVHEPLFALQSAAVAHGVPTFWYPVRSPRQTCGCVPTHCVWFGMQLGAVHVPVIALHRAELAQSGPMLFQPVRPVLHT